jgi:hypothetical protein
LLKEEIMRLRIAVALFMLVATVLIVTPLLALAAGAAAPASQGCGPGVVHTVLRGENLFRISLRYGTTMAAIAQANGIVNINRIYAGQRLLIPCATPGTGALGPLNPAGFVGADGFVIVPQPTPAAPIALIPGQGGLIAPLGADCANFRPTSPLQGMAYGTNTFYWDPAPGATGYRVNIYNLDAFGGALVASFETGAFATNLRAEVSTATAGPGFRFAWEVQALIGGQVACSSPRLSMFRAVPEPGAPTPDFTIEQLGTQVACINAGVPCPPSP